MNAASEGDAALAKGDTLGALQHYTRALVELPRAPTYYIKRSTAYIRYKPTGAGPNVHFALRDAEIALTLARERAKRDMIMAAQMRRAVALYSLERYGDAGFLFGLLEEKVLGGSNKEGESKDAADRVKDVMSGSKGSGPAKALAQELQIWLMKIKVKLGGLEEGDERAKVSVEEVAAGVKVPSEKELKAQLEALKAGKIGDDETTGAGVDAGSKKADGASSGAPKEDKASAPAPAPAQTPEKIRHEWYQSNDSVVVTLYAKGIAKESVDSELRSDSVSVQFPLPSGAEYSFVLDPLFASIDESTSKLTVFGTKIELVLRKKTPGHKWSSLEFTSTDTKPSTTTSTTAITSTPEPPPLASAPSYPTSSRHGAKDWDKVASTLTAKKPKKAHSHGKDRSKEEKKDEGDAEDSDNEGSVDSEYGGDPVDGFFKKLYAGADDETRRAMVKSFVESNGTSLSTNWSEVGKGEVKPYQSKDD